VRNEVLHRVKEINNLHTRKRMKANWVVYILRRKCLLKHITEGKIEGTIEVGGIRRRRRKQLPDDLKLGYWKFKEEELDRICGERAS